MRRVAVGMSGGVDSSVAALLLVESGLDVVGLSLRLLPAPFVVDRLGVCCSPRALAEAARVCDRLGIPHYAVDEVEAFEEAVLRPFAAAYAAGGTPNPCVACNRSIKFGVLFRRAEAIGCDHLATGHYARVVHSAGGVRLLAGIDAARDQSYFLHRVRPDRLARVLFPLGNLRKDDVRAYARRAGLACADAPESIEACFAPDGGYDRAVRAYAPDLPAGGPIEDESGGLLGRHDGHWRFTVGQRRGLGLGGGPARYVSRIEAGRGAVVVADRPEALETRRLEARDARWIVPPPEAFDATVRWRSTHRGAAARVVRTAPDSFVVELDAPGRRVAPGQSIVVYDGEEVLGGGFAC